LFRLADSHGTSSLVVRDGQLIPVQGAATLRAGDEVIAHHRALRRAGSALAARCIGELLAPDIGWPWRSIAWS
jgi:hypothetical protein